VVAEARGKSVLLSSGAVSYTVSLPCTLAASAELNYFELHEKNYRGSVILAQESRGTVSLLNFLDVEQYLRGVVPLEIGPRKPEEMAAVMAQAVVARTYTYRRMLDRRDGPYDLLPTVSDQVYGGVSAERQESDRAIRETSDLILLYNNEPIQAYYHSTCGGMTANIEDVWGKGAQPYLVARPDTNEKGEAYCSISTYFEWDESWKTSHLSAILAKYGRSAFPDHQPFRGTIRKLSVGETYACGRVRTCIVHTAGDDYRFGGDRIRFAFRRAISGRPILRSSRFRVEDCSGSTVRLRGWGYGHGIGMCQMGAVGRARAGQNYHEILQAYYADVDEAMVRVDPEKEVKQ
jgi:stage II sporulation protein D